MKTTAAQSAIGMSSSLGAALITVSELETAIRIAGGLVGLAIGVVTLISMIRKLRAGGSKKDE